MNRWFCKIIKNSENKYYAVMEIEGKQVQGLAENVDYRTLKKSIEDKTGIRILQCKSMIFEKLSNTEKVATIDCTQSRNGDCRVTMEELKNGWKPAWELDKIYSQQEDIKGVDVIMEREILKNVYFQQFKDEFGNLIKEFEVIQYYKSTDNEWIEEKRYQSGRNYYVVDGKLYIKCNDSLLPLNMDFNSNDCGTCYQIAEKVNDNVKITNNEVLFTCNGINTLSLHKQSYSDGTCFYSLQDGQGHYKLSYGSNNTHDLINQLDKEIEAHKKSENDSSINDCKEFQETCRKIIEFKQDIINKLKRINNKLCETYFEFDNKIINGWKVVECNDTYEVYTYTSCKKLGNWQLFLTFDDKEKLFKYFKTQISNTSNNLENDWCRIEHKWFKNTYEELNKKIA